MTFTADRQILRHMLARLRWVLVSTIAFAVAVGCGATTELGEGTGGSHQGGSGGGTTGSGGSLQGGSGGVPIGHGGISQGDFAGEGGIAGQGGSEAGGSGGEDIGGQAGGTIGSGGDEDPSGCVLDELTVTPSENSPTDGCEATYSCHDNITLVVICDGENDGTNTSLCDCHLGSSWKPGGLVDGEGEQACLAGLATCSSMVGDGS